MMTDKAYEQYSRGYVDCGQRILRLLVGLPLDELRMFVNNNERIFINYYSVGWNDRILEFVEGRGQLEQSNNRASRHSPTEDPRRTTHSDRSCI